MAALLIVLVMIALVVAGALAVGLVLKLVWWGLLGLMIGGLARLALPGSQRIGVLLTAGAGVASALLGGIGLGDARRSPAR